MYILLCKLLVSLLPLHIYLDNSVNGMQSYVALFQTDIVGTPYATSNVWIAYNKHIARSKEFTVCHWIKIKFYNFDNAACLWSYCTIEKEGQKMKCLQACMRGNIYTADVFPCDFTRSISFNCWDMIPWITAACEHVLTIRNDWTNTFGCRSWCFPKFFTG